jgi:hypothetical protein
MRFIPLQTPFRNRHASGFFATLRYSRGMGISREQPVSMRRPCPTPGRSPRHENHRDKQGHEYEHARSRVWPVGSGSPRARRCARRQGARGNGRALGPPGRPRRPTVALCRRRLRFPLRLLHAGAPALRGRHLQPYPGGSSLPGLSGDPRIACLRCDVPHLRPDPAPAPHAGEPGSRPRQGLWPKPARDRGPGRSQLRCPRPRWGPR